MSSQTWAILLVVKRMYVDVPACDAWVESAVIMLSLGVDGGLSDFQGYANLRRNIASDSRPTALSAFTMRSNLNLIQFIIEQPYFQTATEAAGHYIQIEERAEGKKETWIWR